MGKTYGIVLIEDGEGDARLVDEMLNDTGLEHKLSWFRDGTGAESFFSEGGRADLILVDLHLPGTNAHDLIRSLRRQGASAEMTIVVYTGSSCPGDLARAMGEGADSYLIKPMGLKEMEEMSAALREMLFGKKKSGAEEEHQVRSGGKI